MNGASPDLRLSEFTSQVKAQEIERYIAKLDRLIIAEPYNAPGVFFRSIETAREDNFQILQYPDIYNYLINSPSSYSRDSLKAYKILEGYKWIQSGSLTYNGT